MIRLWTGNDPVLMSLLQSELDARSIPFSVRNEELQAAVMGGLPPTEVWPELWIMHDTRYEAAEEILRNLQDETGKA